MIEVILFSHLILLVNHLLKTFRIFFRVVICIWLIKSSSSAGCRSRIPMQCIEIYSSPNLALLKLAHLQQQRWSWPLCQSRQFDGNSAMKKSPAHQHWLPRLQKLDVTRYAKLYRSLYDVGSPFVKVYNKAGKFDAMSADEHGVTACSCWATEYRFDQFKTEGGWGVRGDCCLWMWHRI